MLGLPRKTMLSLAAVLFLAACSGGEEEGAGGAGTANESGASTTADPAEPAGGAGTTPPAP